MHCHHGPDPHRARSVDAAEAVAEAEALGMAAIVLKSHADPTGPIELAEQFALVDAARALGVKVLMTHALETLVGPDHRLADVLALAERGAMIEFTYLTCIPGGMAATEEPMTFARAMMAVGPERAVMSTDFGQDKSPHPADGMRLFIEEMLGCGVPAAAIHLMERRNPARLLGLA